MDTDVNFKSIFVQGRTATERGFSARGQKGSKEFHALFVKSIDQEKRQITAYASTGILDRYGDIVEPEAFRETMPLYMKNPVILAAHQHKIETGHSPVVGNVIKWWIDKIGLGIIIEFARGTELADEYWLLYSQKFQRAFSIGFSVVESHDEMRDGLRINIITKLELYEISCVPVPANPDALSKSKQRKRAFVADKIFANSGFKMPSEQECEDFAKALIDDSEQDIFDTDEYETETIEADCFAKMFDSNSGSNKIFSW